MSKKTIQRAGRRVRPALLGAALLGGVLAIGPMAALAQVELTGTVGSTTVDPSATSAQSYLRYVGNPAPAGFSHAYQWGSPRIVCDPETTPATFSGTIDVSAMPTGQEGFIGLLDAGLLGAGYSGFMSGAYVYIYRTANDLRIGPSDGNNGGEIVQTFYTIPNADIPADGILSISLTIDGTADPTSCATPTAGGDAMGCIDVSVDGQSPKTDSYGDVKSFYNNVSNGYYTDHGEFENGAYPGWTDSVGSMIGYDLTLTGCVAVVPETYLDHFKCYEVKDGDDPKTTVTVDDQFDSKDTKVKAAKLVCLPASKNGSEIKTPDSFVLKLYEIEDVKGQPAFEKRGVVLDDQFGEDTVKVEKPKYLAVPAKMEDLP